MPRRQSSRPTLALSHAPASSIPAPSKEGIFGLAHRWFGQRTTRIGGRALSILRRWVTWQRSPAYPVEVVPEHYRRVAANLIFGKTAE
jgi:hypothetical protein